MLHLTQPYLITTIWKKLFINVMVGVEKDYFTKPEQNGSHFLQSILAICIINQLI